VEGGEGQYLAAFERRGGDPCQPARGVAEEACSGTDPDGIGIINRKASDAQALEPREGGVGAAELLKVGDIGERERARGLA